MLQPCSREGSRLVQLCFLSAAVQKHAKRGEAMSMLRGRLQNVMERPSAGEKDHLAFLHHIEKKSG